LEGRCRSQFECWLEVSRGNPVSGRPRLKRVNASGVPGRNVQDPIETKIHPRRKLRMQSSSQAGESSSTQPLRCRVRGNPGTHLNGNAEGQRLGATLKVSRRRSREDNEPGRPGESNLGTAERSRKSGETRRALGRLRENRSEALPLERGNGATRRFKHGSAEGRGTRGNSTIRRSA
jgi:hypothetical protein